MENETLNQSETPPVPAAPEPKKTFVYTVRDWKEYLGESLLIIFSVLLALILTEYFTNLHTRENTRNLIRNIVLELQQNKKYIQQTQVYDDLVLKKIETALQDRELQSKLVVNDVFVLDSLAPQGVLYRFLNSEAWTIAKNNDILSKLDFDTDVKLTQVYEDQARMMKVEDEVAKVLMDRASRDPRQVHLTLVLIHNIYHAWAVDRAASVVAAIDETIKKLEGNLQ